MKYTENYNLKKPDAGDFYNIEDFNVNADKIDSEFKKHENNISSLMNPKWVRVPLSDFADRGTGPLSQVPIAEWEASIMYKSATRTARVHLYTTYVAGVLNADDIFFTIKAPYLPAFEQYGVAMFKHEGERHVCPLKIGTNGQMTIEQGSIQLSTIENFDSIDITYYVPQPKPKREIF